jgi:hypothetical protein
VLPAAGSISGSTGSVPDAFVPFTDKAGLDELDTTTDSFNRLALL